MMCAAQETLFDDDGEAKEGTILKDVSEKQV